VRAFGAGPQLEAAMHDAVSSSRPFWPPLQGSGCCKALIPRALPWAGLGRAFSPLLQSGSRNPGRCAGLPLVGPSAFWKCRFGFWSRLRVPPAPVSAKKAPRPPGSQSSWHSRDRAKHRRNSTQKVHNNRHLRHPAGRRGESAERGLEEARGQPLEPAAKRPSATEASRSALLPTPLCAGCGPARPTREQPNAYQPHQTSQDV
jgi:hypothetical protein